MTAHRQPVNSAAGAALQSPFRCPPITPHQCFSTTPGCEGLRTHASSFALMSCVHGTCSLSRAGCADPLM